MPLVLSDHHTYLNADDASIFHQQKKVIEIEIFQIKNLQTHAICLLIISYQFILLTIKLNAFFKVGEKLTTASLKIQQQ